LVSGLQVSLLPKQKMFCGYDSYGFGASAVPSAACSLAAKICRLLVVTFGFIPGIRLEDVVALPCKDRDSQRDVASSVLITMTLVVCARLMWPLLISKSVPIKPVSLSALLTVKLFKLMYRTTSANTFSYGVATSKVFPPLTGLISEDAAIACW